MNKYKNKKSLFNNETYDSKKESKRAIELKLLEKAGKVSNLKEQVVFILQDKFKLNNKTIRAIKYIADFTYTQNGKTIIEDVKGFKTKEYVIKKKILLNLIANKKIEAEFIET